jgi:ABC-type nickel/cobalt efflux system permease component RcnA
MTRSLISLAVLPVVATAVLAHPLPNLRFDRTVRVRLTATGATVRYTLDVNDWTMVFDSRGLISKEEIGSLTGQTAFGKKYAEKKALLLADGLAAELDGERLAFRPTRVEVERERDHLRLQFQFRADWPPGQAAGKRTFKFEDQNFEDRSGQITLTLDRSDDSIELLEVVDPVDLRGKSPLDYGPGDEKRARRASAVFVIAGAPAEPPPPAPADTPLVVETHGPERSLIEDIRERGLTAVFDSGLGLGLMLLLSAAFGMGHAFTPGHGKTMVAAYLVGERGTVRHAVVLGLVATVAHTGSVIVLAVVIYFAYGNQPPATAQGWLTLAGGLLIAGVGLWLFLQRVRGRADHVHLFGDHHHHHGPDHDHGHHHHHHHAPVEAKTGFGWARVVLLGLGGGIIPCWDAVLLFLVALSRGRVGIAIPLLVAFSFGLAAVLIGLGIGVVYANRAGGRHFGDARWFRFLPVVSAVLLLVIGVWFVRDGWDALVAAEEGRHAAGRP